MKNTAAEILGTVQQASRRKIEIAVGDEGAALRNLIRHAQESLSMLEINAVYSANHNANNLGFLQQAMERYSAALATHKEHAEVVMAIDHLLSEN